MQMPPFTAVVDRVIILWETPGLCSNSCYSYPCWHPSGKCVCCYHGSAINGRCNKAQANILNILTTLGTLLHITSTLISVQYLSLNYQTNCTDYVNLGNQAEVKEGKPLSEPLRTKFYIFSECWLGGVKGEITNYFSNEISNSHPHLLTWAGTESQMKSYWKLNWEKFQDQFSFCISKKGDHLKTLTVRLIFSLKRLTWRYGNSPSNFWGWWYINYRASHEHKLKIK